MELKETDNNYLIYVNGELKHRVPVGEAEGVLKKIEKELVNEGYKRTWSSTNDAEGTVYMNKEKYALAIVQAKRSLGVFDANGKEIFLGDIVELKDGSGAFGEAWIEFGGDGLYFYDRNSRNMGWDRLKRASFKGPDVVKKSDVIFKEKF